MRAAVSSASRSEASSGERIVSLRWVCEVAAEADEAQRGQSPPQAHDVGRKARPGAGDECSGAVANRCNLTGVPELRLALAV
jgi:hypothetical protein